MDSSWVLQTQHQQTELNFLYDSLLLLSSLFLWKPGLTTQCSPRGLQMRWGIDKYIVLNRLNSRGNEAMVLFLLHHWHQALLVRCSLLCPSSEHISSTLHVFWTIFQLREYLLSGPGFLKSQLQSLNQFQTSLYQGRRTSKVFSSFFTLSPSHSGAFVFYSLHQGEEPLRHKCFWVTISHEASLSSQKVRQLQDMPLGTPPNLTLQDSKTFFLWHKYQFLGPHCLDNVWTPKCPVYRQVSENCGPIRHVFKKKQDLKRLWHY